MALSRANIKARLATAYADPALPGEIKTDLDRWFDESEGVGLTKAQKAAKVDAFLDSAQPWDPAEYAAVKRLVARNWEDIPA